MSPFDKDYKSKMPTQKKHPKRPVTITQPPKNPRAKLDHDADPAKLDKLKRGRSI